MTPSPQRKVYQLKQRKDRGFVPLAISGPRPASHPLPSYEIRIRAANLHHPYMYVLYIRYIVPCGPLMPFSSPHVLRTIPCFPSQSSQLLVISLARAA